MILLASSDTLFLIRPYGIPLQRFLGCFIRLRALEYVCRPSSEGFSFQMLGFRASWGSALVLERFRAALQPLVCFMGLQPPLEGLGFARIRFPPSPAGHLQCRCSVLSGFVFWGLWQYGFGLCCGVATGCSSFSADMEASRLEGVCMSVGFAIVTSWTTETK